jgi:hypothetical protein
LRFIPISAGDHHGSGNLGLQDEMENPRIAMGTGKDGSGVVLRTSLWRSPRTARASPLDDEKGRMRD